MRKVAAHDDFLAVEATLNADSRREADRERKAAARAAPVPIATDSTADDGASLHRPFTRRSMCDRVWWKSWGNKVSPTLHSHLFGFESPELMRHFLDTFFSEQMQSKVVTSSMLCTQTREVLMVPKYWLVFKKTPTRFGSPRFFREKSVAIGTRQRLPSTRIRQSPGQHGPSSPTEV